MNVGVYIENNTSVKVISLFNLEKYSLLYAAPDLKSAEVVYCNNTLYAVGLDASNNEGVQLMALTKDKWITLLTLFNEDPDEDSNFSITVVDTSIYIYNQLTET